MFGHVVFVDFGVHGGFVFQGCCSFAIGYADSGHVRSCFVSAGHEKGHVLGERMFGMEMTIEKGTDDKGRRKRPMTRKENSRASRAMTVP